MTYKQCLERLRTRHPFAFSRWGDGEWACMAHTAVSRQHANCDKHRYFQTLGQALFRVLIDKPSYGMGLQPKATQDDPECIIRMLGAAAFTPVWGDADIFHDASQAGTFWDSFWGAIEEGGYAKVIVGPSSLILDYRIMEHTTEEIMVPERNCWLNYEATKAKCVEFCEEFLLAHQHPLVLCCCGMMANVLIHELWQMYGERVTLLDMGSVFDPYVGKDSRRYHWKIMEREGTCPESQDS